MKAKNEKFSLVNNLNTCFKNLQAFRTFKEGKKIRLYDLYQEAADYSGVTFNAIQAVSRTGGSLNPSLLVAIKLHEYFNVFMKVEFSEMFKTIEGDQPEK